MKITCPSCAADYNVPGVLAAGRIVRCAKCATEWTPVPPPLAPVMAQAVAPVFTVVVPDVPAAPLERLAPQSETLVQPRGGRALLLAWAGSGLVIVAALALAIVFRAPIMRAWPPSQRVYGMLALRSAAPAHLEGAAAPPPQHAAPSANVHGNVAE